MADYRTEKQTVVVVAGHGAEMVNDSYSKKVKGKKMLCSCIVVALAI